MPDPTRRRLACWGIHALVVMCAATIACKTTRIERPTLPAGKPTPGPPAPSPTPVPTPPAPAPMPTSHIEAPLVRVLLERTGGEIDLPQPGRPYLLSWTGGSEWAWGPLRVTAMGQSQWQVGAFQDAGSAAAVSQRLTAALGDAAEVLRFTGDDGLVRVRVRWQPREPQNPADELERAGFPGAFPVAGDAQIHIDGSVKPIETTGQVTLEPQGDWPTVVGGRSYRGRFYLRVVGSELLVINELNLESYLRGVLPAEMGPYQFPELQALKAQAVAARTYTVAHLGDHDDEGYDICATPACQVYRGVGVEHALTDRAVEETAGLIAVFDGRPIDAMYTSTCGGHTEDAGLLFPDRAQPYLAGVPCAWERPMMLQGIAGGEIFDGGSEFRQYMAVEALGLPKNDPSLQAMIDRVASLCGGVAGRIGTEPSLAEFVQSLMVAGGLDETVVLVGKPGVGQLVSLADLYDVPLDSPDPARWTDGWHLRAALAVLQVQGIVTEDRGEAVPHQEGVAIYPRRAEKSEPLPETLPLYWRWNDRYGSADDVRVLPGTTLERFRRGEDVLALVVVQSGGGGEADRRSAWRSWIRDKSWHELAQQLEISDLERLEVTRRGPSGRVVGMVAEGRSGSRRELEGFPIRLDLGVPENLFTFHVLTSPDGNRTARFLGRGWGHGIGLCQNGAYGLARAGQTFDAILTTYYTGISIERWSGSEGTGSP